MRISLNWLKEYVDIEVSPEELAHQLTMLGLEIEAIERPGKEITQVCIGQVLEIAPHPDADRLSVCKTDIGADEPLQIVCGATNMKVGDKVPTAVIGATLPGGFQIGRRKMRGIESQGMMCSSKELGLGADHSGLMILDPSLPIGADAKALLGLDDVIFEIEVTPNRGDWAGMLGAARELAALYGKPLRIPETPLEESGPEAATFASVTIEDPENCPRYLGRVLTNVKIGPSPEWLRQRVIAAGQRPINNVVDVTNFVLMETGHPLHAFDYANLAEHRIVVRRAKPGERMHTLDEAERTLTEDMLVIADGQHPQAVAGIMGGQDSEVGEKATTIFLESAVFNPVSIRKTSRALGLASESSQRFQRGADPKMARYAIDRAAQLMQQCAGATIAPGRLDEYPRPFPERTVKLRYARALEFLGMDIPAETQRDTLVRLGFDILESAEDGCTLRIPSWRHDVAMEADLMEEIGRHFNYDNLPVTLPNIRPARQIFAPECARIRALRQHLAGLGLTERYHWTFSSPEDVERTGLDAPYRDMVALANPLSEKQATLRSSILPALLANAAKNIRHGASSLATFEIGPVYLPTADELPRQETRLALVLTGNAAERHWSAPPRPADFYDIKGLAEEILCFFHAAPSFEPAEFGPCQSGQTLAVSIGGARIGWLGKVKNTVKKNHDLDQEVYVLELGLDPLLAEKPFRPQFQEIPAFPPSLRDMALLVDAAVPAAVLVETALASGGKLLQRVEIFDVFTGGQVPEGKKSVALSLVFQSSEKTLTDKETQKAYDKILKQLKSNHRAVLR